MKPWNLLLAFTLVASAAHAHPAAPDSARRALQSALNHGDATAMLKARAQFEALSNADPKSAVLHAWVATADWRAVPLLNGKDLKLGERYAKDGLAQCDQALAIDGKFAEVLALKGILLGMSITYDPASAMTLGPQSGANIQTALAVAPRNPRVWLLAGITALSRPVQFGGGPEAAEPLLAHSLELFAAGSTATDSLTTAASLDWGRDDAPLWLGRAAMARKDYAAARDRFQAALAVNPENGWVRSALLPEAEKALAGAARP